MKAICSCFAIFFILFLSSCGSKPEKDIIGKWRVTETMTVEFFKDETVKFSENDVQESETYAFIDKNRVRLKIDGESHVFEVQISKNKLSLTDSEGKVLECLRVRDSAATGELLGLNRKAQFKAMATEATTNLAVIRTCQKAYKAANGMYLECAPSPPGGGTDASPDAWSDAGGFGDINFAPSGIVRFQYAVEVNDGGKSFTATATGDLDENGVNVTYTVSNAQSAAIKSPADEY